ncbi:MAG: hypothetical protein MRY83_25015 [Flavobacteriales bacterium]|nr:hypothetical protein [Flavobacteriales bacterium]
MNLKNTILDEYNIRARLYPVLLLIGPLLAYLLVIIPDKDKEIFWGFSIVILPIGYVLISNIRNKGKKVEERLFGSFDKLPTHLAIENPKFLEEELSLPKNILDNIPMKESTESTVRDLINRTRDHKLFPVVFDTLCVYGFYRNTYGIRLLMCCLTIVLGVITVTMMILGYLPHVKPFTIWAFLIIDFAFVIFIWTNITLKAVKRSANNYARAILRASITLDK